MKPAPITVRDRADSDPARGFSNAREYLQSVKSDSQATDRDGVKDYRLKALTLSQGSGEMVYLLPRAFHPASIRAAAGSDEQGNYSDTYGGFLRQSSISSVVLSRAEADPTGGRTLALPMDSPEMHVLARTDSDHSTSVSGGLTVVRTGETLPRASSRLALERITFRASDLSGFSWASEQLLGNNPSAVIALLESAYRDEFAARLLREKISGRGGDQFLGVLHSPAKIEIEKEGSQPGDTIVAANVVKMRARAWGYSRAIWMANPNTYPQLAALSIAIGDGGALALYHHSEREGEPDTLSGRPIFYSEFLPTLGDAGDLICVNWSQYIEATYMPLQTDESIHVRFLNLERAFRFNVRNAGAPWWRAPLTPDNGADTISPIVTLETRG